MLKKNGIGQMTMVALLLAGCASSDEVPSSSPPNAAAPAGGSSDVTSGSSSPTTSNSPSPNASQPTTNLTTSNGSTAANGVESTSTTSDGPSPAGEGVGTGQMPCDVASIVSEHCSTCHGATPKFNAPMSLMAVSDFTAMAPLSGQPAHAASSKRINLTGAGQMPPVGTVEALDPADLEILTAWLDGGAKPAESGCQVTESGSASEETMAPKPSNTGSLQGPYEGWDEGVTCYPFLTYDPAVKDKSKPYKVGLANDKYMGFGYKPPWEGTRYVRAFRAVTDNSQVLHHWILFQESVADGSVAEIVGAHPGGAMMNGWAPGGTDLYFTPDLGMKMDSNSTYLLEVHYNSSDINAQDASGVEICVTEEVPENEVIVHWLGTDMISGTSSSGTCTPRATEPIHIIGGNPHMHLKGKHMKVELTRKDGTKEILHDEPFSFENQRGYPEDVMINPGDSIKTTCDFTAPSSFGKGTNEEMCYWFALAYPAGALSDGGLLGTLFHGPNSCLGL